MSNCANEVRKASSKVQLQGCMVGSGVTVAFKSVLRGSVIGVGCTIGQKVSITNSVLMDNVVVEDGYDASSGVGALNPNSASVLC